MSTEARDISGGTDEVKNQGAAHNKGGLVVYEGGMVEPVRPECSPEIMRRVRELKEEGNTLSGEERDARWERLKVEEPDVIAYLEDLKRYFEAQREFNDRRSSQREEAIMAQSRTATGIVNAALARNAMRIRAIMTSCVEGEERKKASGE